MLYSKDPDATRKSAQKQQKCYKCSFVFKSRQRFLFLAMAKQENTQPITGTIDGICFYEMEGTYYARQKSSLTGKRVTEDPCFTSTMWHANLLARASGIVKPIYASMPAHVKKQFSYQVLTGKTMRLLKAGKTDEDCFTTLQLLVKQTS